MTLITYREPQAATEWTSLKSKWDLRLLRVTHCVIFNVILYAFYEWNEETVYQLNTIQCVNA